MTRRYTSEMEKWLADHYDAGSIRDTMDAFDARFGWCPTKQALYQKAYKLGLVKRRSKHDRGKRVERTVRWTDPSCEEYRDWMLEHDRGHAMDPVIDAFRDRFGFTLNRTQVSQFRARYGIGQRRGYNGVDPKPIGTERDTGKGYILVKVAERPTVPLSKDNWRMKHHLVWEEANGRPVPEGHEILFADKDHGNFDPDNLVAVDKRVVGILNTNGAQYFDAASLKLAVMQARLMSKIREKESGSTRVCKVCGETFEPNDVQKGYRKPVKTCPRCLAAGRKWRGEPKRTYRRTCPVCGAEFDAPKKSQRRCPACIARGPKHSVKQQRRAS